MNENEHTEQEERQRELSEFFKKNWQWICYIITGYVLWVGYAIRTSNINLLWDYTRENYLPIALDPHLFLRYARIILENGALPAVDTLRYVPVGFEVAFERTLVSYVTVYFYKIVNIFSPSFSLEHAHVLYPAVFWVLGCIVFFFLLKRLFNVPIATVATALLAFIPAYLYRTMAGFSDKESLGMFLMFLAMYFYVVGWQNKSNVKTILFGFLSGIAALFMSMSWGGAKFLYLIMGSFILILAFLNALEKKDFYQYAAWFIGILIFVILRPELMGFRILTTSVTSAIMVIALGVAFINYLFFQLDVFKLKHRISQKLPLGVACFIIAAVLGIVVLMFALGPKFFIEKISSVYLDLVSPFGQDRWQLTVAENHQPYVSSWLGQMGGFLFMIFYIIGGLALFYQSMSPIKKYLHKFRHPVVTYVSVYSVAAILYFLYLFKVGNYWLSGLLAAGLAGFLFYSYKIDYLQSPKKNAFAVLTIIIGFGTLLYLFWLFKTQELLLWSILLFVVLGYCCYTYLKGFSLQETLSLFFLSFLLFFVFSRYSGGSILNGVNTTSKVLYIGSLIVFFLGLLIVYLHIFYKDKDLYQHVRAIDKNAVFVLVWFVILIIGARGAARLLFVFSPIVCALVAYAAVKPIELLFKKGHSIVWKIAVPLVMVILLLSPIAIGGLGKGIIIQFHEQVKGQAPHTGPSYSRQWQTAGKWIRETTPEDAVFAHWWDYGYWVQTGGERATVTDGGNAIGAWNYLMGRHVLTAENTTEALEALYAHNATHLLIISDEIGKYTAYSSIGSDINYDRFAQISTYSLNPSATQETRNGVTYVFQGGAPLDDDFIFEGKLFPAQQSGIGAFFFPVDAEKNVQQPRAVVVYQGQQIEVPLGCVYISGQVVEYESEFPGCLVIIPAIGNGQGNPLGAALWVSGRGVNALWTQLFLFEQGLSGKEHPEFVKVYDDSQSIPLSVFNGRVIGPLKIWEIQYPENFTISDELREIYTSNLYENPEARQIGRRFG